MANSKLSQEEIAAIASQYGLSPSLVNAVISQESGGNPNAVSNKGATGLMQVMPSTGAEVASKLGYSNYDLNDPSTNVNIGSKYLSDLQNKYKDERLTLAAYNSGPGRVDELRKQYGNEYEKIAPYLYPETQDYVPGVQSKNTGSSQQSTQQSTSSGEKPSDVLLNLAKKKGQDYAMDKGKEALLGDAVGGTTAYSATANGATLFSGGATYGGTAVGTAANGGTLMSTGEVVPAAAGEAVGSAGAAEAAGGLTAGAALGIIGGAYGGYKTAEYTGSAPSGGERNKNSAMGGAASGAAIGAGVGSIVPGIGTAIGAVVGGIIGGAAGFIGSEFGSNKDKDQMARDAVRKSMIEQKIIGNDYSFTLADGSRYDIGRDGAFKIKNKGQNIDGKTERQAFDVDFSNPLAAETTAEAMALGMILTGGHKKLSDDFTGYITNAALSNATDQGTAVKNLQAITKQMMGAGLTQDSAKSILDQLKANNRIDVNAYNVAVSKLPILFGTSQPITAQGAAAQKKTGGIVESPANLPAPIAPPGQRPTFIPNPPQQQPVPVPRPTFNPALTAAAKNTTTAQGQSPTDASRWSPQLKRVLPS